MLTGIKAPVRKWSSGLRIEKILNFENELDFSAELEENSFPRGGWIELNWIKYRMKTCSFDIQSMRPIEMNWNKLIMMFHYFIIIFRP